MTVRSVVFDVGETLISDEREWHAWADWIGVPRHVFLIVLGGVIAAGRDNADTFTYFRPGFDVHAERAARERAGRGERIDDSDLYPDVRPALHALREAGFWIGIAGNQTARAGELLTALNLPADLVATSGEWGCAKPDPAFFARIIELAPGQPSEILYVGDHPANDIHPAHTAGLRTAHIRRGPYAHLTPHHAQPDWTIHRLTDLPGLLHTQERYETR
jgi:FMN phosphatase YigB (HAD superfamily)